MERRDHVLIGFFVFGGDGFFRFGQQMVVNERAFFE